MTSFRNKLVALSFAAAVFPANFADASAADATAYATAEIIQAIAVTKEADFSFGSITAGATATATFAVAGAANQAFTVTLPADTTLTSGGNSMTVDTFTQSAGTNLDGSGAATIDIGATLNVGVNQADGNYTGTYDVTVDYN